VDCNLHLSTDVCHLIVLNFVCLSKAGDTIVVIYKGLSQACKKEFKSSSRATLCPILRPNYMFHWLSLVCITPTVIFTFTNDDDDATLLGCIDSVISLSSSKTRREKSNWSRNRSVLYSVCDLDSMQYIDAPL